MYENSSFIDRFCLSIRIFTASIIASFNVIFPSYGDQLIYDIKKLSHIVDNDDYDYDYEEVLDSIQSSESGSCSLAEESSRFSPEPRPDEEQSYSSTHTDQSYERQGAPERDDGVSSHPNDSECQVLRSSA